MGSSPLTRGKLLGAGVEDTEIGLIPAHAGKTLHSPTTEWRWRAHPRSRGENVAFIPIRRHRPGSSPLTRGKRTHSVQVGSQSGLIPAHAGKTATPADVYCVSQAHPRSRGENALSPRFPVSTPGSSPLTRGKRTHSVQVGSQSGLIPAHAGKTRCGALAPGRWGAHPRSRGENSHDWPLLS